MATTPPARKTCARPENPPREQVAMPVRIDPRRYSRQQAVSRYKKVEALIDQPALSRSFLV
ncbi:hypothetical protein [Pseudomonas chlororaphis]|uniref:hypothetical protein n=1 Tax=Pseudomonas chlororaphis TaxID=587753 RepID=UPI000F5755F7|nr:hypothetical protein [Pseudomonas chlororaphis]UVE46735.1 hypothetical protein KS461_05460 [Pseudomonas chlororaphis]